MRHTMSRSAAGWLTLAALAACHSTGTPVGERAAAPRFTRVSDATSLAILLTTNNVDLAYARLGTARATHRDVKALANRMAVDHALLNTTLAQLRTRLDLTPREDDISGALRDQSALVRDTLRALAATRFDSAYVANEVRFHREVLVAIDRALLPSAQRSALREYVTTLRPTLSAHLAHAERVQATLAAQP